MKVVSNGGVNGRRSRMNSGSDKPTTAIMNARRSRERLLCQECLDDGDERGRARVHRDADDDRERHRHHADFPMKLARKGLWEASDKREGGTRGAARLTNGDEAGTGTEGAA